MDYSPAYVLATLLINAGKLGDPEATSLVWPVYVGNLPVGGNVPEQAASCADTVGLQDGRLMSGEQILHHGVQVRVRSADGQAAYAKLAAVTAYLQTVHLASVTISAKVFKVANVSQVAPALFMGLEDGTKRRVHYSCNFLMTLRQEA